MSPDEVPSEIAFTVDDGRSVMPGAPTVVKMEGTRCELVEEGIVSFKNLVELTQFTILFVCTGNTCRSPMAETILRNKIQKKFPDAFRNGAVPPIITMSAGVSAAQGYPASEGAWRRWREWGGSLESCQPACYANAA